MENTQEQISTIRNYIQRSIEQGKPYAYEIVLVTANNRTELVSRIKGLDTFDEDMRQSLSTAQSSGGDLEVKVFRGLHHNAALANNYTIKIKNTESSAGDVKSLVKEALMEILPQVKEASPQPTPVDGLGSLDMLIGALTADNGGKEGIAGLIGLATKSSEEANKLAITESKHEFEKFKLETQRNDFKEKHSVLEMKYRRLISKYKSSKENNDNLEKEVAELEDKLKGYTPNEMVKRVSIGVLGKIGANMLASPKIADALNLSPDELKGALGLIDENETDTPPMATSPVSIAAIEEVKFLTPEERQKKEMIDNFIDTFNGLDYDTLGKVYHIISIALLREDILNGILNTANNIQERIKANNAGGTTTTPTVGQPTIVDNTAELDDEDADDSEEEDTED